MFKIKKASALFLITILMVAALASPALAWQMREPDEEEPGATVIVAAGEVINDDLFLAGQHIRIDGTVNGDVVAFANTVDVTGVINGDLLVGCNTLTISGSVNDDLRIGAQSARITGTVKRNLSAGVSQLMLDKEAVVGGNAAIGGENVNIAGTIQGGMQAGAESFNLTGAIGKNVRLHTNNLNVLPGASIGGSLSYRGENKGNISPEAKIGGPVTYKYFVPQHRDRNEMERAAWTGHLIGLLGAFMALMLIWLLWFYLHPGSFIKVQSALKRAPWASLGWGLALLILMPIAALLVMITVVGIPISIGAMILYTAILFMGKLIVGYGLAHYLATRYEVSALEKPFAAAAAGTLGLMLLSLVPWVGPIITIAVALMALGSVFVAVRDGLAARKGEN